MSAQAPVTTSQPKETARPAEPKVNLHTEIQQIRRIVNGANKRLERLEQAVKK